MRDTAGRFERGSSGNPNGRPKLSVSETAIRNAAWEKLTFWMSQPPGKIAKSEAEFEITGLDRIICTAITNAMNGNQRAIESFLDRFFGKAPQSIELTGKDGEAMEFRNQFSHLSDQDMLKLAMEAIEAKKKELAIG